MSARDMPRAIVATGPGRDELVVMGVIWTPEDAAALRAQLDAVAEKDRRRGH